MEKYYQKEKLGGGGEGYVSKLPSIRVKLSKWSDYGGIPRILKIFVVVLLRLDMGSWISGSLSKLPPLMELVFGEPWPFQNSHVAVKVFNGKKTLF